MTRLKPRALWVLAAGMSAAFVLAGCTGNIAQQPPGGSASGQPASNSRALTIASGPTGPFVPGLNPFSTTDSAGIMGVQSLVYEPLIMFNSANPTESKPWLASKYAWSDGGKTLTFTIPTGRAWSDGTPLSAADVAFTFQLMQKYPALNVNGVVFRSVSAPSATTAVITFNAPAYSQLYQIGQVLIVPQHIWSKISDPVKYPNDNPVGSGPYLLQSTTAQAMTFTKNPKYWQKDLPKVDTIRVPDYTSQNSAINAISAGQVDWNNVFLSNTQQMWTSKDPAHNKLWLAPAGDWFLCPNNAAAPFNSAAVRKALAISIDRKTIVPAVEGQYYAPSTNPTGLRGTQDNLIPSAYKGKTLAYNPAQARKELLAAGFKSGSGGVLTQPNGKPFTVSLELPSDYTDWMSLGQLIVNNMKKAGIDVTLRGVSDNAWLADVATGNYQLTFCGLWATSGPYDTYNTLLNSTLSAPVGKNAVSNVSRWNDAKTDAFLAQYRDTADKSQQDAAIGGLATIVAEDAPIIPFMSVSSFGSYTTKNFTGWPSATNPYQSDIIHDPFTLDVVLHLEPAS